MLTAYGFKSDDAVAVADLSQRRPLYCRVTGDT